ncbi:MAG: DUF3747 domain-containing protein [Aphanocapsa sp. GSE-SYN-MK-11-07L]|jgi:hypothetical protein|nr:DUF3747 domain-containing protein [Aphanocapsa sp. GSE-SYN-MK-11-07L]
MKYLLRLGVATVAAAVLGGAQVKAAIAAQFQQQEIDQSKYIALAMPLASGHYKLLVLQQISTARQCWSESGTAPIVVDPLLVNFDFTGICSRNADSNGYSIRVAGEDLALKYSLSIDHQGNELLLVGRAAGAPPMVIARTHGMADGFQKFLLEPGWRLSRRAFNGKPLGHVYFTNDSVSAITGGSMTSAAPAPISPPQIPAPTTPPEAMPIAPIAVPEPVASESPASPPAPVEPAPVPVVPVPAPVMPEPVPSPITPATAEAQPVSIPIQLRRRGPR